MARLARIVAPGCPHHVTARGNRREPIFFEDGDQDIYRNLLAEQLDKAGVEAWAYCLMPNHVHLILRPADEGGLAFATIRAAETTGRPLATASFVTDLELRLGRPIARRAPGRKPSAGSQQQPVLL